MVKKLTKHGNSMALVIDRPILELLNFGDDTPLDISTDGHRLIIELASESPRRRKFVDAMEKSHRKFAKTFKKLAE